MSRTDARPPKITSQPATMVDRHSPELNPLDLRYPGGKGLAGLYQWICARLPSHVYYAAPFAGKDAVHRNKAPALRTWLIDRDPRIVEWWHRQQIPPGGIATGDDAADDHGCDRQFRRCALAVIHGCGIRFVELAAEWQIPDLLVYLDPPYLPSTRRRLNLYRYEMTFDDHVRLLTAATILRGPVVVSGYWSELYAEMLAGWQLDTRDVITRGGTLRTECLWSNSEAARASSSVAMEYGSLGGDFRERQRVDRKVQRWTARFAEMDDRERRAILLALLDAERERSVCRRPRRKRR